MKTLEKVSFAKFFPESQQYVVIRGKASSPSDFGLTVDIGDGENKSTFYLDPWSNRDSSAILKAMSDAVQQALEFYEKALRLPAMPSTEKIPYDSLYQMFNKEKPAKAAKKPAAKKKKAAAKK